MATAALAAQPPLTTKNSFACTLPSGCGNSSTRKTSSSTMIPVQRMRGARSAEEDIRAVLDVASNDVVGDRDRRRRGQAMRVRTVQHQDQFLAVEPARVFKFFTIDDDRIRQCFGMAADHDRRRERPRLRCEIAYPAARNAYLFGDL